MWGTAKCVRPPLDRKRAVSISGVFLLIHVGGNSAKMFVFIQSRLGHVEIIKRKAYRPYEMETGLLLLFELAKYFFLRSPKFVMWKET